MKNPQFMKNINPNFSKKHKLIITTGLKHVINIQSINYKRSILPNFIQLNKILNLLNNT